MKKILLFTFGFTFLLSIFTLTNRFLSAKIYATENFSLGTNTTQLLAGNSRLAVVNPKLFENTANICSGRESYYYTYFVLKKAIDANPQLKRIFLTCSYDNFTKCLDQIDGATDRIEYYLTALDWNHFKSYQLKPKNFKVLLKKLGIPFKIEDEAKLVASYKFGLINQENVSFYGGFYESNNTNIELDKIQETISEVFLCENNTFENSTTMESYFHKIINLCNNNDIELVFINPPFYPSFLEEIPEEAIKNYDRIIIDAKDKYPTLKFLDFTNFILPDSLYGDLTHVNNKGAIPYSDSIKTALKVNY